MITVISFLVNFSLEKPPLAPDKLKILNCLESRGGILLGILGGGVPPASSNLDPISDQKV